MKIDIEVYELKAFQKADELFATVEINVVFMEWKIKLMRTRYSDSEIEDFLEFFYSRDYKCYSYNLYELKKKFVGTWPNDIIWIKNDFTIE